MIERRPFEKLGGARYDWLKTKHHFSFADYFDPQRMSWGALRVWNDDEIAPETGFPPHPHADMEIITYVRQGAITHQDSLGNKGRTEAGDVQVMSAGTGIRHSEYNLEPETTKIGSPVQPRPSGAAPGADRVTAASAIAASSANCARMRARSAISSSYWPSSIASADLSRSRMLSLSALASRR